MPFKSIAQRGFLYTNKPEVAKEFESRAPKETKLPKKTDARAEAMRLILNKRNGG